jgi:hypothetical protein
MAAAFLLISLSLALYSVKLETLKPGKCDLSMEEKEPTANFPILTKELIELEETLLSNQLTKRSWCQTSPQP